MNNSQLFLTNTLIGKKELFEPISLGKVKMYVCGITPYDNPHLGHGRVYVTFDVLFRLLRFLNYEVTYCRNFTDIDDKLISKAQQELNDGFKYQEIANKFIDIFNNNMLQLNCLAPNFEPKVTQNIDEIITFISKLIDNGFAYQVNGDVYYEVRKFKDYGKLSKRKIEDLKSGARVQVNEEKKDPLDFALWKSEESNTFFKSPWGFGRPGWHIECSALALKYLGEHIDIHGGGMDLIFPHHENEIAQSEGLFGPPFANYWVHNAFVRIDKEKMSKSLGNFFTLNEIFEKINPMVLRFYYLNHNYNIPLDFSFDELERFKKNYQRFCKLFENVITGDVTLDQIKENKIVQKLLNFLLNDLNVAGMLGLFYEDLPYLQNNPNELAMVKAFFENVLGLTLKPIEQKTVEITPEIQKIIDERELARKNKDWKKADELRDKLKELGIEVHDKVLK